MPLQRGDRARLLRPGQMIGALLTALSVAAVATGAVIENWGRSIGLVVGAIAVAVISLTAAFVQQRVVLRRTEERLLRAHVRVLDHGRLPLLGAPRSGRGSAIVVAALRVRWFVVVSGDHAAQAAVDAARAVFPGRRLLVPVDGHSLSMLLAELDLSGTVVWLGDIDEFLGRDGATTSLLDRLATVADLTVLATRSPGARTDPSLPDAARMLRLATVVEVTESELVLPGPDDRPAVPDRRPATGTRRTAVLATLAVAGAGLVAGSPTGTAAGCGLIPAELRVVTSAALAPILRGLIGQFRREVNDGGCQRANVQVQSTTSGGATIEALSRGWSSDDYRELAFAPDVWVPDSTVDIERVRLALQRSGSRDVTLDSKGSMAYSPIVLAVPRSRLPELATAGILERGDGSDRTFRWLDLVTVASGVGIVRTGPRSSSAGLAATFALYRSALGLATGAELDRQPLTAAGAAHKLRSVELRIASTYEENSALLCSMRTAATSGLLVPVVVEWSTVDYNDGRPLGGDCAAASGPAVDPLVPLTADDGTPFLDYPVVQVRWGRPAQSRQRGVMADRFAEFLRQDSVLSRLLGHGFRDQNSAIGNGWLSPNRPTRVTLPTGPQADDLLSAWAEARRPTRMLLVVDVSRPMSQVSRGLDGDYVRAAVLAVQNSLRLIGDRDHIGLWESATGVDGPRGHRELVPTGAAGEQGRKKAVELALARLRAGTAAPAISQTVQAAVDRLRSAGATDLSNAIVVLTTADSHDVGAIALASRTPIFLVVFGADSCQTAVSSTLRESIVDSGGNCFTVEGLSDVRRAMDGLAAALWGKP